MTNNRTLPLRIAELVRLFGTRLIPLDRDKHPLIRWRDLQQTPPTEVELSQWFSGPGEGANVGILTGYSGVILVDCDTPEAVGWADMHLPPTTLRVATSRGEHRYYRVPNGKHIKNRAGLHEPGGVALRMDIRGHGGLVVAPGSVHRSGRIYSIIGGGGLPKSLDELPVFDPEWYAGMCTCSRPNGICLSNRILGIEDTQEESTITERDRSGFRCDLTPIPNTTNQTTLRAHMLAEKQFYGIREGGRDHALFTLACHCVVGFLLSEQSCIEVLSRANSTFSPPLPEATVRAKIASARRSARGAPGYLLGDRPQRKHIIVDPTPRQHEQQPLTNHGSLVESDRDFLTSIVLSGRAGPTWKHKATRLKRQAECGMSKALMDCEDHGTDHDRHLVCEGDVACIYCALKRAAAHRSYISQAWPAHVTACMFEVEEGDNYTLRKVRQLARSYIPRREQYRWFLGIRKGIIFMRDTPAYLQHFLSKEGRAGWAKVVTREEAAKLVEDVWIESAVSFLTAVRNRDADGVMFHPYIENAGLEPIRRTDASTECDTLPMLTQVELRNVLVNSARKARGCALNQCSHRDTPSSPVCAKPLSACYVDNVTGEVLYHAHHESPLWKSAETVFTLLHMNRCYRLKQPGSGVAAQRDIPSKRKDRYLFQLVT